MNIKTLLEQQGVYDPLLEKNLIDAINREALCVPPHSIPPDPIKAEELEWIMPLDLSLSLRQIA